METLRGIGFDLDHTLAVDNRLERVALMRMLDGLIAQGGRTLGTFTEEIDAIDALLARQRSGEFTIDAAVEAFVREHGCEPRPAHAREFREMALAMVDDFVVPLPGVARTLTELERRGVASAVLTNGWNPLQLAKARRAGFQGPVLVSGDIGARKPAAAAFEFLLRALELPAGEVWYVGDDPLSDIAGARDAGLQTVWLDWERKAYPPGLAAPDHTIAAFDRLLEIASPPVRAR